MKAKDSLPSPDTLAGVARAPQQTRSHASLRKMLVAGRELLDETGDLARFSIADIVERAGTSVGAFYRRFDNKDALFDAVQEAALSEGIAWVEARVTSRAEWQSGNPAILADEIVRLYVRAFRTNRGLYHASLLRASQRSNAWDAVKLGNRRVLDLVVPPLAAALSARGGTTRSQADFEVRAALQMIIGMLVNSVLNDPGPLSLTSRRLPTYLMQQFRRLLVLPVR
jgi:AcrR family transcriptional regulator